MPKTKGLLDNQVLYDNYVFTKDKKTGYYLSARPILNGKRARLHVYIWVKRYGPVPPGMVVHHMDENKDHNYALNLTLLPTGKHSQMHTLNFHKDEAKHTGWREKFEPARQAGTDAYKGPEHTEQRSEASKCGWAKKVATKPMTPITCCICGKTHYTYFPSRTKYCSAACKARALRVRFKEEGKDYTYGQSSKRKSEIG